MILQDATFALRLIPNLRFLFIRHRMTMPQSQKSHLENDSLLNQHLSSYFYRVYRIH
jgi:hypothetical protein